MSTNLRITRPQPSDSGQYDCIAKNLFGSTITSAMVLVEPRISQLEYRYNLSEPVGKLCNGDRETTGKRPFDDAQFHHEVDHEENNGFAQNNRDRHSAQKMTGADRSESSSDNETNRKSTENSLPECDQSTPPIDSMEKDGLPKIASIDCFETELNAKKWSDLKPEYNPTKIDRKKNEYGANPEGSLDDLRSR